MLEPRQTAIRLQAASICRRPRRPLPKSLLVHSNGFTGLTWSPIAAFTGCVTDGSNPGLPAVETLNDPYGQAVVIRNGLESISFEVDVENCYAYFTVNLFFWPSVNRGTL